MSVRAMTAPYFIAYLIGATCISSTWGQSPQTTSAPGAVNVEFSRVFPFVEGKGLGHSHGVEAKLTSSRLVLGQNENAGVLTFDMQSFDVDTPQSRVVVGLEGEASDWSRKKVNAEMHGPKILDSKTFPTAQFKVDSSLPAGIDGKTGLPMYQLIGSFTLRNQTQRITFPVTVQEERGWLRVRGRFAFQQSNYGITPFSRAFGAMGVRDTITVTGDLWVAPTPQAIASLRQATPKR
ncbi:MAG: YceI family protein [Planctomycetota bacterium]